MYGDCIMFFNKSQNSGELQRLSLEVEQLKKENDKMDKALDKLEQIYVRVEEFRPIKSIIYGAVAIILVGVMGAALATIGLS